MISLIVTTDGSRNAEFKRLLESLANQTYNDFEIIVIFQTKNKETLDIINNFNLKIKSIITTQISLSKARNLGLDIAVGKYVGFPDDDCWYPNYLLEKVSSLLKKYDTICCNAFDPINNKFLLSRQAKKKEVKIKVINSTKYPISIGIFAKKDTIRFDECLGVGTEWGSGEESDYLLQKIYLKKSVLFFKDILVYHPFLNVSENKMIDKSYYYGKGYGALIKKSLNRKQWLILIDMITIISRSLGGCLFYYFGNKNKSKIYLNRIKGIVYGLKKFKIGE